MILILNTHHMQIIDLLSSHISYEFMYCNVFECAAAGVMLHCNVQMKRDRDSRLLLKETQITATLMWDLKYERSRVGGEERKITSINRCQTGMAVARAMPGQRRVANVSGRPSEAQTCACTHAHNDTIRVCTLSCRPACASGQTS